MRYFLLIFILLEACTLGSVDLEHSTLQVGLLDTLYEDRVDVDENWNDFFNIDHQYYFTGGRLPYGVEVLDGGRVFGIPQEVGDFDFEVSVYGVEGYGYSYQGEYLDSEWYTLFVTEPSTNPDCVSPDNESVTEIYLCLGEIEREDYDVDDRVTLDVTFYVNPRKVSKYDIKQIHFVLHYNPDYFGFSDTLLNSESLREVANHAQASVTYTPLNPGELQVALVTEKTFKRQGRLIDLPVTILVPPQDQSLSFTFSDLEIIPKKDSTNLPSFVSIDGAIIADSD